MMTDEADPPRKRKPSSPAKTGEADPAQYARFLEAARELGCDESARSLDDVVRRAAKLSPQRPWPKTKEGK